MTPATMLTELASWRADLETAGKWPARQMTLLAQAGVFGWMIPRRWGGSELDEPEILRGYLELADACLTSAFILTQFNSAVQKLVTCGRETLQESWLPRLARGECFTTVGISHLTTSRSRGPGPAVTAEPIADGFRLSGHIPWVTGANASQLIVVGGTAPNGEQLLAAIETTDPGLTIAPPQKFLALTASQTGSIELRNVTIRPEQIVAGPALEVLKVGSRGGSGSLSTSTLALGTSRSILRALCDELRQNPSLEPMVSQFFDEGRLLEDALFATSRCEPGACSAEQIRLRANSYVTRLAQSSLAAAKGTGFVSGHPAERAIREAMFFYVWSCPQAVVYGNLQELAFTLPRR
ncbi:MAG: acyl-CoA dehydrogenase [Planctomycetes bacterium]|nr:acyl-CoA dehydrogenase [Planctomycetota bacterium]